MKIITTIPEMRTTRSSINDTVGFVPTMGYLHQGHLSLVKQACQENAVTVVSIYVNPTQFGPNEDFKSYPRDIKRDLNLLENEHVDFVFMPSTEEMYPEPYYTWIEVDKITNVLEGESRPGHFKGVTTIVAKLFNIVNPTKAYFGQKDAQQARVIKKMVIDLNMNVNVIILPTIRESDGLAMSSRNVYLNAQERQSATILYKALLLAKQMFHEGETNADYVRQKMNSLIESEPLANIDYISIANEQTLEEQSFLNKNTLISLAVKIGKTRLIDNIIL